MERTKFEWRRELLAARAAIPEGERRRRSLVMVDRVRRLPAFGPARSLLGYLPIGAEADPASLLAANGPLSRACFIPSSDQTGEKLRWAAWPNEGGAERIGADGLEYPVIAIVPGVGFDAQGVRLGRGRSFYDHALAELRSVGATIAVGFAFRCQIVPRLPSDPWDEPVDFVVSEDGVISPECSTVGLLPEPTRR